MIYDAKAVLGEGPFWHADQKCLFWLDIERHQLHRFKNGQNEAFDIGCKLGCAVPVKNEPNSLLIASQNGVERIWLPSLERRVLAHPEADKPFNRYNDGKCSPDGRFFFGSLNMQKMPNLASLYSYSSKGVALELSGLTNSNGLCWSPDAKTFYLIDTPTLRVDAFDYDAECTPSIFNRRTVVQISTGRPDGMTIDAEGMLWIAHWLGSQISRWNPKNGKCLLSVPLPVSKVTSLAFGGNDLSTLYITTAKHEDEPLSGGLFAVRTDTQGLPSYEFVAGG